jgi:hypothetical protein
MAREYFTTSGLGASSYLYFISKHFQSGLIIIPSDFRLDQAREALSFFLVVIEGMSLGNLILIDSNLKGVP